MYVRVVAAAGEACVEWSNAGHLPPLLVAADGTTKVLAQRHGPPMGVTDIERFDAADSLPAGDALLLYTDGLVERADRDLDDGVGLLARTCQTLHALPLEQFCDELISRVEPTGSDDLALLAVRPE